MARPSTHFGFALLFSLVVLAAISLLAVMAARSTLQQQSMAANHADDEMARLAAISAVRAGEHYVMQLATNARTSNCTADCFDPIVAAVIQPGFQAPEWVEYESDSWWLAAGTPLPAPTQDSEVQGGQAAAWSVRNRQPPTFLIEELKFLVAESLPQSDEAPPVEGVGYYRVLGRGTGAGSHSTHVMESILARPWQGALAGSNDGIPDCQLFRAWYDCGSVAYRERR